MAPVQKDSHLYDGGSFWERVETVCNDMTKRIAAIQCGVPRNPPFAMLNNKYQYAKEKESDPLLPEQEEQQLVV